MIAEQGGPRPHNQPEFFDLKDASRGIRIQKALSQAGVASRRGCEELVHEGRVRVNGVLVKELPAWVDLHRDNVEVDGERVEARPERGGVRKGGYGRGEKNGYTYIVLNKPRRVISTTDDPEGRMNVLELIDEHLEARVFPVGRLDADSTGLMLLTDDGELAHHLTHPSFEVPKQYEVAVRGNLSEEDVRKMRSGVHLADVRKGEGSKKAVVDHIRVLGTHRDRFGTTRTKLLITLSEGQNREIRRILAKLGIKTRKLKRVALGPLRLKGLRLGQYRHLTAAEVDMLYKTAGMKK